MSSPDIQTLISRSCLINNENGKNVTINPDDLEHPTKLIKFLVGVRHQNEYFPLAGTFMAHDAAYFVTLLKKHT